MLKLIQADLYKSFHRPYLYIFAGILSALAVLYNTMYMKMAIENSFFYSLQLVCMLPFFAVMAVDIIMAEEMKYGVLKNTVSSGIGRGKIFISKSISSIIVMLFVAAVTFLIYLSSAFVLLRPGKGYTAAFMSDYLQRISLSILLVVGAILFAMFLAVIFQKNSVYAFTFAGLMLIPTLLFEGFAHTVSPVFWYFCEATILGQANGMKDLPQTLFYQPVLVTVAHIVVFLIAGILIFRRREIN